MGYIKYVISIYFVGSRTFSKSNQPNLLLPLLHQITISFRFWVIGCLGGEKSLKSFKKLNILLPDGSRPTAALCGSVDREDYCYESDEPAEFPQPEKKNQKRRRGRRSLLTDLVAWFLPKGPTVAGGMARLAVTDVTGCPNYANVNDGCPDVVGAIVRDVLVVTPVVTWICLTTPICAGLSPPVAPPAPLPALVADPVVRPPGPPPSQSNYLLILFALNLV